MNKVKIIVDSCSDMTNELYKKYDLEVIPLQVIIEEKTYHDGVDITIDDLFKSVEKTGELPHTSGVAPTQFEAIFKKYIDQDFDIIYIGLGSKLSTTFQSAFIAKQSFPEGRIFLIDSQNLSTGISLLAIKACEYRDAGMLAQEIANKVSDLVPNVVAQFTVDTLDYLHKGGRCSGASKLIGHIFHVHPYIQVQNGSLIVYKKPRGPMKIAVNEQINELKSTLPNVYTDHIFITYSSLDKDLQKYIYDELSKIVPKESILITIAGSVIASHCGPGCIGILYLKK